MNEFGHFSPEDEEYVLNLPFHLVQAGMVEHLHGLLTEFEFLEYKVSALGPQSLVKDYELTLRNIKLSQLSKESLRLIQSALQLSVNTLKEDPTQLAAQLWGRLMSIELPEVQALLQQTKQTNSTWLRPISASLALAGDILLTTIEGHSAEVNAIAISPDSQWVISGSDDKTLRVWNLQTYQETFVLKGHNGAVNAIAITPDSRWVISGSDDKTLKVWNLQTGKEIFTLKGHSSSICGVAVTPDGKILISGSADNALKIWNLETRNEQLTFHTRTKWPFFLIPNVIKRPESLYAINLTPDGKQIISGSGFFAYSEYAINEGGKLNIWNLETGKYLFSSNYYHSSDVLTVAVTSDGKRLISGSVDQTLEVWDLKTRTERFTLTGHSGSVNAIAITPDSRYAFSGSDDKTLKVWSLETGSELYSLREHIDSVTSVAVASDSKKLISGSKDKTLKIWNLEKILKTILEQEKAGISLLQRGHSQRVSAVSVTPHSRQAISGSDDTTLKVWDLETGRELLTIKGHSDSVSAITVTPDSKYLISASKDKTLKIWDIRTGEKVLTLVVGIWIRIFLAISSAIALICFFGLGIIATSDSLDISYCWKLISGSFGLFSGIIVSLFMESWESSYTIDSIIFSSDGKQFVSHSEDGTLIAWDLEKKKNVISKLCNNFLLICMFFVSLSILAAFLYSILYTKSIEIGLILVEVIALVLLVFLFPFCLFPLITSISAFDIKDKKKDDISVDSTSVPVDVKRILIFPEKDNAIVACDLNAYQTIERISNNNGYTLNPSNTNYGQWIISGFKENSLKVWNSFSLEKEIGDYMEDDSVSYCTVTPDGKWLVSVSGNNTLKLRDLSNGKLIANFTGDSALTSFAFSKDGMKIVVGESLGRVHFLQLEGIDTFTK